MSGPARSECLARSDGDAGRVEQPSRELFAIEPGTPNVGEEIHTGRRDPACDAGNRGDARRHDPSAVSVRVSDLGNLVAGERQSGHGGVLNELRDSEIHASGEVRQVGTEGGWSDG